MFRFVILFVFSLMFIQSRAGAGETPERLKVPIRKAYIPVGFDSNDRSEVVVTGILPDTCHKIGPSHAFVDPSTNRVTVEQEAYRFEGGCMDMIIPFMQVIPVGMVGRGNYEVADMTTGKTLGRLAVEEGKNPSTDDFLYLPVTSAHVQESESGPASIVLVGNYADRCTKFKQAVVHYYPEVVVVQPIVERVEDRNCGEAFTRFSINVSLEKTLHGTHLIHVRSMGGQSVNTLFTFR